MKSTFQIQNLKCGGCENTIAKGLIALEGVDYVSINILDNTVSLTIEDELTLSKVFKKLSLLGYPVLGTDNTLINKASSYFSCAVGKISQLSH